jgi:hypothetical protein
MIEQPIDYDGVWKEALDEYFVEFMAFFFPQAYNDINWDKDYESLNNELQQITRDAESGKRYVDKLVKVWRNDGQEAWVLVHIEIQSQTDAGFSKRMYTYNYRIYDKYDRIVASFAVLGDENPNWKPSSFGYELWGCEIGFKFPSVKLADYRDKWTELDISDNPFASVVMAHLKTQETKGNVEARKFWKFFLIRRLHEKGYGREDIRKLLIFIDWLMYLPEEIERQLHYEIKKYEEEGNMPHVTSFEKFAREEGLEQGLERGILEGIKLMLDFRFGDAGLGLLPEISEIKNVELLRKILAELKTANSPEELRKIYCQQNNN